MKIIQKPLKVAAHQSSKALCRQKILYVFGVMWLCISAVSCSSGNKTSSSNQTTSDWQSIVDSMESLTQNLQIPEHMRKEDAVKTGEEFDVNKYFSVLNHLSMQPGYILDYVYFFNMMGGSPFIYAREIDKSPYLTSSKYEEALAEISSDKPGYRYLDHIQIDDTAEGYFQFIVLRIMGGQFYLFWHSLYDDAEIVCDRAAVKNILAELSGPNIIWAKPDFTHKLRARFLKLKPRIKFSADRVLVRVVIFTKWGGFIRRSYSISRNFPHKILQEEEKTLVYYDCAIMF